MKRYDKSFGMELKTDCVNKILQVFFKTANENPRIVKKLAQQFHKLLLDILQCFGGQTRYHIYASSVLLLYDHKENS